MQGPSPRVYCSSSIRADTGTGGAQRRLGDSVVQDHHPGARQSDDVGRHLAQRAGGRGAAAGRHHAGHDPCAPITRHFRPADDGEVEEGGPAVPLAGLLAERLSAPRGPGFTHPDEMPPGVAPSVPGLSFGYPSRLEPPTRPVWGGAPVRRSGRTPPGRGRPG